MYLGDDEQVRSIRTLFRTSLRNLADLYSPIPDALAALRVPALVVWGTRDPFFTLATGRRTAAAIPGAQFVALEDAGHFLPEERPAEIAQLTAALVSGSVERPPSRPIRA